MEVEDQPMKPEPVIEEEKVPDSLLPREAQISEQPRLCFQLNPVFEGRQELRHASTLVERRSGVESFASNGRKQSHENLNEYKAFAAYHHENDSRWQPRASESSEFSFKKNAKQAVLGKESFQEEFSVFQKPDNFENMEDLSPTLELPVL